MLKKALKWVKNGEKWPKNLKKDPKTRIFQYSTNMVLFNRLKPCALFLFLLS